MSILVAGELNVDLVLQNYHSFPRLGQEVLVDDVSLTLGSASAICAAGLARLGEAVSFVGKLGCDQWGDLVMETLRGFGVDLAHVLRDPAIKTGITVSITSAKDRALVTYLGSIAALRAAEIEDGWFAHYRHLHVSSFFMQQALRPDVRTLLARARRHGLTTSIDPGFDPSEQWGADLTEALDEADLFFPNEVELAAVTGESDPAAALRVLAGRRAVTIAKLGARGCMTLVEGRLVEVPEFPIDPVDTTGAGDSFNAGFLHRWLAGRNIEESMRYGAACGALSTQGLGGTAAQPTHEQVAEFLAAREVRS
jgi:sugar/nucleoside kinase (ribokinase family)